MERHDLPLFAVIALEQRSKCLIVWFQNHSYLDDICQPLFLFPKRRPLVIGLVSGDWTCVWSTDISLCLAGRFYSVGNLVEVTLTTNPVLRRKVLFGLLVERY